MMETYGPLVVGLAALAGAVWLLMATLRKRRLARTLTRRWLSVPGRVVRSTYREANFGSEKSRNARANSYLLDVVYEYQVDGTPYRSRRPLLFGLYTLNDIEPFVAQYPAGCAATVYVNPKRHDQAVLDPRILGKGGRHELGFALILFAVAGILVALRVDVLLSWFSGPGV